MVVGFDNFDPFYDRAVKEKNLKSSISHDSFELIEGDITDSEALKKLFNEHTFEVVVHLGQRRVLGRRLRIHSDIIG